MLNGNEQSKKMGELISRVWSDETFKNRLLSDTMSVMKENGVVVPEGVEVKAVENTNNVFYLVIPPKPNRDLINDHACLALHSAALVGGHPITHQCTCNRFAETM